MKRIIPLFAAAIMIFAAAFPVSALTKAEGYNAHDVEKLTAFLEQADAEGVKSGEKLSENYDPADPATWGRLSENEPCFTWTGDAEKRIRGIVVYQKDLVGELDVSGCEKLNSLSITGNSITAADASGCAALFELFADGCGLTELDITGCENLSWIRAAENRLTELDISDCPLLDYIHVSDNLLTELDVSNVPDLYFLSCVGNGLTELDITNCPKLQYLYAADNAIGELDLSHNPLIYRMTFGGNPIERLDLTGITQPDVIYCQGCPLKCIDLHTLVEFPVKAVYTEGNGVTDYAYSANTSSGSMTAVPDEGESFLGWFTPDGTLVSEYAYMPIQWNSPTVLIARFSGPAALRGDADLSGAIDTTDALLTLRCALRIDGAFVDMPQCDMDGSGTIDTTDALMVLRAALGIAA